MLQPRRPPPLGYRRPHCALVILILCLCADFANTDNVEHILSNHDRTRNGERFRRHDSDVTILSLEEDAKSPRAQGVLSSTARTFVQGGTTTEFTTQVLGTSVGRTYAKLLSTGSRVFYGDSRPASREKLKPTDAFLVFPTILPKVSLDSAAVSPTKVFEVQPTQSLDDVQKVQYVGTNENFNKLTLDDLFDLSDTRQSVQQVLPNNDDRENVVSVRKEYSVKRNSDVKPAKVVKPGSDLPTFTVRNEFAPSGFSLDEPEEKKEELVKPGKRNGKALFRGGIPVKQDKTLDTVTYFGFADFTTTVGDTVIVFMPKTPDPHLAGAVTSITGEATLRPEDAAMPVVTTVKTFMSHSPGMPTKTVTGHSLSMHTSLPTVMADPAVRQSKAYEPVYVPALPAEDDGNRLGIDPTSSTTDVNESIESSMDVDVKLSEVSATEPLNFATTTTQVYNSAAEPLGLVKSIGGTEARDGTTTVFTSFVYGTVIDGAYKQLIQSASSVFIDVGDGVITTTGVGIGIAPSSVTESLESAEPEWTTPGSEIHTTEEGEITTEGETTPSGPPVVFPEETTAENEISNEVDNTSKGSSGDHTSEDDVAPQSTAGYVTRVIPSTGYKTFTYLTTFFIPDENGGQTTSIRSREVTSEEVSYVTKVINANVESISPTIAPSEVITESIPTTNPQQETTTVTEEVRTEPLPASSESTTPQIPVTVPDQFTTTQPVPTTEQEEEEDKTTVSPTTPKAQEDEAEVDLIFKTLYTTYTYLTTFFQESSTSVSSREVVVTNVITTTLDNAFASDPAVAGLFNKGQQTNFPSASDILEPAPTSVGIGRPTTKYFEDSLNVQDEDLFTSTLESVDIEKELQTPTPALDSVNEITEDAYKTFYTTYTYFTTVFVDGETEVESRTEVYTNIVTPTGVLSNIKPTSELQLFSSDYVSVLPDEQVESPEDIAETNSPVELRSTPAKIYDSTISRPKVIKDNEVAPVSEDVNGYGIQATDIDDAYKYDTTMSRAHSSESTRTVDEQDLMNARQQELSKEEKQLLGITPAEDAEVLQTVVVDVTSSSSGGSRKVYRESYDDPDDQITSESNTEEIEPSFSPTILLQTSFTTFTYFTTVYKGTTSDVISRLDTVTNVVTETLGPSDIEASLSPEEATLPITYFTTFTYWTTLYKDGNTMVTSREETVSNIVTPTVTDIEPTESVDITPSPLVKSLVLPTVLTSVVGENSVDFPPEPKQLDSSIPDDQDPAIITPSPTKQTPSKDNQVDKEVKESAKDGTTLDLEPTTFYTTYTYFTTSYIGNSTVLNSRLETVTNIVAPTAPVTDSSDEVTTESSEMSDENEPNIKQTAGPVLKPTGLISTIRTSEVNDGITTLLSTDVFGTYIDGLYAQILESSTQVLTNTDVPISTSAVSTESQPTGVVSINEGKIVDADGVSTTFFTTKAIGTYIDKLYAQVVESTTSVNVDEDKKTAVQSLDPSTTIVGSKTFRTGLVRLIEGSIVKDKTTTFYESRVIGTLIEGRYAQIIESTSSFKIEMTPTPIPDIAATAVSSGEVEITPTATVSTSPSPAAIESSIGENEDQEDQDEENDDDDSKGKSKSRLSFSSRKKTFTPVIRPFASRPRPTFLPKKKTGDVGSATTITRNAFTPTITATPAIKSSDRGFGSSRNRFAGGRRSSSSVSIQPTASASSGRRFSGRRSSSSGVSPSSISQSSYRGRTSGRVSPTSTLSIGSSSRRGSFNYRTSSSGIRSSSVIPSNSRFRIRPTLSSTIARPLQTVSSTTEDIVNTNDIAGTTIVTEENLYTEQDEEQETSPPTTTTTESARRSNNPLLRFRRPPILQRSSTTTTTPKPSTTPSRRNNLLRRPDARGGATTPITPTRNKPAPTFPPRNRQRPSNSLFPPRGLVRKPTPADEAEEEEADEDKIDDNEQEDTRLDDENDFSDNDYEGSEHSESHHSSDNTTTTEAPKTDRRAKALGTVQIRPFQGFKRPRTKRQAEYGSRNYRTRYQSRSRTSSPDYDSDEYEPLPSEQPTTRTPSRFTPRSRGQTDRTEQTQPRVRPTKPSPTAGRAQFTLRDRSSTQTTRTSNFKRPPSRRRPPETTTVAQRPKPPRLRSQTSTKTNTHTQPKETTYTTRNNGRRFSSSRGRTSSRSRYRDNTDFDTYSYSQSTFDGTITVTHQVPTEVTIPVVNGKVTEYKNVITAKPSLEILAPHQYTTATGKDGNVVIQLTSEVTSTLPNGVMEITKFLVYETPTTSITFTPTTLRGRKTSFSHIIPSTVYDVRQDVSTVEPQIAPNAPLANLLLSQLLLGNLNLQQNPPPLNPLLGLQNQPIVPPTPTTEYKTKTTTYVTTVTDHTSTVIPLTYRGVQILTTIVDSSTQVITATEYLTETVVVTPTAALGSNPQQINSLLLPALLQAQLLGQSQQPSINPTNPLLGTLQQQILPQNILNIQEERPQVEEPQGIITRRRPIEEEEEDILLPQEPEPEVIEPPKVNSSPKARKKLKGKNTNKKTPDIPQPAVAETSVVTLYVSGRRPGDFSTILSTVTLGEESSVTLRKREAEYIVNDREQLKLESSKLPEIGSSFSTPDDSYLNYYVMSALNEVPVDGSEIETQSLESIVGDVSRYLTIDQSRINTDTVGKASKISLDKPSDEYKISSSKTNKKATGHFLSKSPAEVAPHQRKGNINFNWSNRTVKNTDDSVFFTYGKSMRVKRQIEEVPVEQPRRRRVRVRVPIQKRVNIDEDLTPSEAQRSHDITHQDLLQTQDVLSKISEYGTRKVKVLRKRPKTDQLDVSEPTVIEQSTTARRKVAVRRRRPVGTPVYENYFTQTQPDNNNKFDIQPSETYEESPEVYQTETLLPVPQQKRKKVLVTRRRPVQQPTPESIEESIPEPTKRKKIRVTKKRPVVKTEDTIEPATIFSNFFIGLNTDYDYENPALNTELEETNNDNSYKVDNDDTNENKQQPETEIRDHYNEEDIDNSRVAFQSPGNQPHVSYSAVESDRIHDNETPESIVWYYEPTDEVIIDITPYAPDSTSEFSTTEIYSTESVLHSIEGNTEPPSTTWVVDTTSEVSPVIPDEPIVTELHKAQNHDTPVTPPDTKLQLEETLEFEGSPKFVRPTKSSVTRKPTRKITGYPGTRRHQSVSSTIALSAASGSPYKSQKPSLKKYGSSRQAELSPTGVQDSVINTEFLIDKKDVDLQPLDASVVSSMNEDLGEPSVTTPSLAESSSPSDHPLPYLTPTLETTSLDRSPESELPVTPALPTSYITTTVTTTRLRTYTYVVTRVSGDESIVTSSTSVKPAVKTVTLTLPIVPQADTATEADEGRAFQLATKVMSNGVEVIVAGDRTTMPGEEVLRRLPASLTRPVTLAPSTLSDAMMMLLPQDSTQNGQELVTKTYLTTYTYRTTLLERGETVVSSREEVVSNIATEEKRPSVTVTPTPVTQVTLTASPSLATGVFHTTYTYLNTLVDGEIPLVVTSRRTVSNTVTAPEDLLQPSETASQDTNTYLNTVSFTKTLADGSDFKIISTADVMTQVIITESDNKASSVEIKPTPLTTDVVKTYFVTYTYFKTMLDGEDTVVQSEVATSSDVVTEKFVIPPKRTSSNAEVVKKTNDKIVQTKAPEVEASTENPINVLATKTYLTTFTYFTTLLQDNGGNPSTIVSSRTNVVQNIVTETLDTELLDSDYLSSLRSSLQTDSLPIVATATLNNGQKMEITAIGEQPVKQTMSPLNELSSSFEETSANNNVITGSTIIFFDEDDQIDTFTPSASKTLAIEVAGHTKINHPSTTDNQETTESTTESQSESLALAESQALTLTTGDSETEESQHTYETSILASSTTTKNGATLLPGAQVIKFKDNHGSVSIIPVSDPVVKHPDGTHSTGTGANNAVSNFLNLGSLGINSLNALGPVINAMAGLIKNNLKKDQRRRNDTIGVTASEQTDHHLRNNPLMMYAGPKAPPSQKTAVRSPIYIPVGGLAADSEAEESQNIEGHNVFPDINQRNKQSVVLGKPTMESPLLAGGIPISPGQVITANSDVIIGKHSVHGPRPPQEFGPKPYRKDDVPLGMKPPPIPKIKPNWPVRDQSGNYIPLGHPPPRESPFKHPPPPQREHPYTPYREHLHNYDTINYKPELFKHPNQHQNQRQNQHQNQPQNQHQNQPQNQHQKHPSDNNKRPAVSYNEFVILPPRKEPEHNNNPEQRPQQQNKPYYPPQQNIQVYNNVPNNNFDTRPVAHTDTEALNTINNNVEYVNPIQHAPVILPDNTNFVDQSAVNPLLVNIQPSQVANVIIPHGSSTALIYSGEHSQKGEIFNDPSPYPDAEVDHVVDALSTARPAPEGEGITHAARVPINADNLEVPVAPHGINVAAGNQMYQQNHNAFSRPDHQNNQVYHPQTHSHVGYQPQYEHNQRRPINNNQNYNNNQQIFPEKRPSQNEPSGLGEYLRPPPPPPNHYHASERRPEEDDYVFGEEPADQEGGEVTQESNARPLRPGQLPTELSTNPSTSMPIDPVDDERHNGVSHNHNQRPDRLARPSQDINFSIVNSKPVRLDGLSNNNQAPIINGRPGVNTLTEQSQATLSVGSQTKLRPDGSMAIADETVSHFHHNDRPIDTIFVKPAVYSEANHHDHRPMMKEPVYYDNKQQNKLPKPVHDNTVITMSLDEKPPPPPGYETPPPSLNTGPADLDTQANTPRPIGVANPALNQFDRNSQQDDSVMGLSPPPPEKMYPHEETSTRPVLQLGVPQRRPVLPPLRKPKPPPPYKFEIPPQSHNPEPPRPVLPEFERPKPLVLSETLSPPKPTQEDYFLNKLPPKRPIQTERPEVIQQWPQTKPKPIIVAQDIMNPVLQGVLTVEEQPQPPEVITADSKVLTNVIKGQMPKPEVGIKITGSQPALQTVVVGKPVPIPVTDVAPEIIRPTAVDKPKETKEWTEGFIVGSETIIDDRHHSATPIEELEHLSSKSKSSVLVTTGVTTIFGNLFTKPTATVKTPKPTKAVQNHHSVISMVIEPPKENKTERPVEKVEVNEKKNHHQIVLTVEGPDGELGEFDDIVTAPPPSTFVVTHTQTTTVTTTQTTVVHSKGQDPSTHTLVLTKTQTSTLLDTVTEVHTLVKQTSILSTVTTTIPQATSTVYTGSANLEPEVYTVAPHDNLETTKAPVKKEEKPAEDPRDNESIFVVMTDKKPGSVPIHRVPVQDSQPPEIQVPDEANEISPNVLLGNILTHPPSDTECRPECKASRNELCQKIDNVMRCVCRPGFARMFPDRPCKPTYTYTMRLVLDRYGKDQIRYVGPLEDPMSGPYQRLVDASREGLDRMVMQSDLRDIYHGLEVKGFEPARTPDNAIVKFYIQLSDNTEESRLQDVLRKSLRTNNYSLGGTEVYAEKEQIQYLLAEDFDECSSAKYHDCSEDAQCFNLRGTYTCSCKEGFTDLSPNTQYPGRICSSEQIGCELCNYHGTCFSRNNEEIMCECFQWYGGAACQINLKVLLLILVTVGVCLVVLLVVCVVLACMRRRDRQPALRPSTGYRRYRGPTGSGDKRAMISVDTSSEGSVEQAPPAYIKQAAMTVQRQQKVLRKAAASKGPAPAPLHNMGTMEQRDRSLTVMIPRAKYRPAPAQPSNTLLTMSTFGPEQKLLNYLTPSPEGHNTPDKQGGSRNTSRKPSNSTNQSEQVRSRKPSSQPPPPRKPSTGALVSAGFEVSATVGRTKELTEAFLEGPHTDLSQPGFNTIRTGESCIIVDIPPPPTLEAELEEVIAKVDRLTVSEARSYDETTIHPPTKSLHRDYDTKRLSNGSHRANDEGHTMVERDIGSTFLMPQTHLFKPERGESDVSNFDSL